MNLENIITMAANNPQIVTMLAKQFGIDPTLASGSAAALMSVLGGGLQKQVSEQGVEPLENALKTGQHGQYIENPKSLLDNIPEGNAILGHILGNKDVSRATAAKVSGQTGVEAKLLKSMLPILAMVIMGYLIKSKAQNNESLASIVGMLDTDGDGNPLNDIMKMIG